MSKMFEIDEGTLRALSLHRLSTKYEKDEQALAMLSMMMMRRAESGVAVYKPEHPIVLFEGQILDGRHRQLAAIAVLDAGYNVRPTATNFDGSETQAAAYAFEENVSRRMMSREKRLSRLIELLHFFGDDLDPEKGVEVSGLSKGRVQDVIRAFKKFPPAIREKIRAGEKTLGGAKREQTDQDGMRFDFQLGKIRSTRVRTGMHVSRMKNRVRYTEIALDVVSDYAAKFDGHVRAGKSPSAARELVLGELDWGKLEKSLNLT